jgi:hypothetical protein
LNSTGFNELAHSSDGFVENHETIEFEPPLVARIARSTVL